jgi:NAD(P)-dependent dehydrogenase (short-subunit alcohol dehydrogenase family)
MRFAGRTVVITGGGSGIGETLVQRFAEEGAAVVVADVDGARARGVAAVIGEQGGKAIATETDVRSASDVAEMAAAAGRAFGQVDVLVNNAASFVGGEIVSLDEADWDLDVEVSLKGAFLCTRAVLPGMIEGGRGVILNIGSVSGLGAFGDPAYSAAKAGLINLTENIAVRYGRHGVRANAIAPGTVLTPLWEERVAKDPTLLSRLAEWYPLRRLGQPADVAHAVLFLASDEASWITGIALRVDGGLLAGSDTLARTVRVEPPDTI